MFVTVDGLRIYYEIGGLGPCVLLLHGWGGQVESFSPVFDFLLDHFTVCGLDLPGFGRSDDPPAPWGTGDYSLFVESFLSRLGFSSVHIIAHSFGGRIAIVLAATYPQRVDRLVLVDSAGIRPRRAAGYYARVWLAKGIKTVLSSRICGQRGAALAEKALGFLGSDDYRQDGKHRATLVKIVNEDLRSLLPQIRSPTLLVWGSNDQFVPLADARLMEQAIPDATLIVLEEAGHFSYLDRLDQFLLIVRTFLGPPSRC